LFIVSVLRYIFLKTEVRKLEKKSILYLGTSAALSLLFIMVFIEVANDMSEHEMDKFDQVISTYTQHFINDNLTSLMSFLTFFGGGPWLAGAVIVLAFLLVLQKKPVYAVYLIFSSGVGGLANKFLKWLFQRERPDEMQLIVQHGYSFPSGHSMGSMIFYGSLIIIAGKIIHKKAVVWLVAICSIFLIVSIGISRIYLGVHYPSDVVAGFVAGAAWLLICGILLEYTEYRYRHIKKQKQKQMIYKRG
jgi:membrane-associated phospholipid phosphatase